MSEYDDTLILYTTKNCNSVGLKEVGWIITLALYTTHCTKTVRTLLPKTHTSLVALNNILPCGEKGTPDCGCKSFKVLLEKPSKFIRTSITV